MQRKNDSQIPSLHNRDYRVERKERTSVSLRVTTTTIELLPRKTYRQR